MHTHPYKNLTSLFLSHTLIPQNHIIEERVLYPLLLFVHVSEDTFWKSTHINTVASFAFIARSANTYQIYHRHSGFSQGRYSTRWRLIPDVAIRAANSKPLLRLDGRGVGILEHQRTTRQYR